ncbi:MAG: DMT family transporter [archaeon]|nr:DMT family transporter [archaeon]
MDIQEIKKMDHDKKKKIGLLMGILCALYWGIWYVPGYAIYSQPLIDEVYYNVLASGFSDDVSMIAQAVFLTAINAIACALVLFVWNGGLGKIGEFKRTLVQFNSASKYFLMAGGCGACAVFGTYLAALFLSPGFAAVAGLLYPIIGTIGSVLVLKQKVSKRAYVAVIVLLIGGITLYMGSMITDSSVNTIGLIGGIMAAVGWGCEGIAAGKALDLCEPDVGLHLRFCFEAIIWVIVLIALTAAGLPMFDTIGKLADPTTLLVVLLIGLSFAWCYVTWYKSFPLLGVARGQAIGSLYAAFGVIFLSIFFGPQNALGYDDSSMMIIVGSTILGLIICLIGAYIMASENSDDLVSLRGSS